ncbi:MAG TPA: hypothetical protein PJ994_11265 [Tepidiformaceae bacterium]|nr:hypothetical protein [Tepidiformaceae bacterium]
MADEVTLSPDAERALQEAQNFCWQTNVGIVAPEHLLAGVPDEMKVQEAILLSQGSGDSALTQNVMFGSAAREAINFTARLVREAGGGEIDMPTLAYGIIQSGEVGPMFFGALGVGKAELVELLGG